MTVSDPAVVDAIGLDRGSGEAVLSVADALAWDDVASHVELLHRKLDAYRDFVASGELAQRWPDTAGRPVRVDVVFAAAPPEDVEAGLEVRRAAWRELDLRLEWSVAGGASRGD